MDTAIPANWVAAAYGMPRVCSRHGEPAVEGVKTRLQSRPPGWAYALLVVGALPYLIAVYATRKTVVAPLWPYCAQCKSLRIRRLVIGWVGLVGGGALFCGGAVSDSGGQPTATGGLLIVLGLVVAIVGLAFAARSARAAVARARVSQEGTWVEVLKPDGRFAAQVAMLLQQANAQQGYAQQGYAQQAYPPAYGQYPPAQSGRYQQPGGYGTSGRAR